MKILYVITVCALVACNKDDAADTTHTTAAPADNTKLNERDRGGATPTPIDQSNSKMDIDISAQIRKQLVADDALSTDAKNVKIISQGGMVVLRGSVDSEAEKNTVGSKASGVAGVKHVENDLDVVLEKRGNP